MSQSAANQAEREAFRKIKQLLGDVTVLVRPAGSSQSFPDFAFTKKIDGNVVDIFFEFKMNTRAPMGSSRRWRFDGEDFSVPDDTRLEELILIDALNQSKESKQKAAALLTKLRTFFDPRVTNISTSTFGVEPDTAMRQQKMLAFKNNAGPLTISGGVKDERLGKTVVDRYRRKFAESRRSKAAYSVCFFVIGNEMWFVDEYGSLNVDKQKEIARLFGVEEIPVLKDLSARVEARISPKISEKKMDVNASTRLNGRPSTSGVKIF